MRITESIYLGVSLVLCFTDEFTGRIVSGPELKVQISGVRGPLRKQDGYYVFTGVSGDEAQVTVESPWYSPGSFELPVRREGKLQVQRLRLCPAASHPLTREATCVYGKAAPKETIAACCPAAGDYRKLLTDGKKGEAKLSVYGHEDEDLEGSCFCIMEGNGKGEVIELGSPVKPGIGTYCLKAPLRENHRKMGAKLCILRRTRADAEGNYFLPLSVGGSGSREYLFWRQMTDKKKQGEFKAHMLDEGVKTRLDWEGSR